ncbi:Fusaric acid resistance protein-like [Nakamurella panacisegetis]|uniref:Fusaric acid resistance protein-like n=1 Tax=Nakamurella panacisegetis TaxID=1090615 RepID=A0A1H0SBQ7_9ACTN|nr:FUSC family protein [Nakamurella panacisegetis]SDP39184.1 Fusaric acid resistance protein-like [Nakamurella panacisegetis]
MSVPHAERPVPDRGISRIAQQFRDAHDRFVASDPGWARLRQGLRAAVAVGSTLLVELALARILGRPAVLGLLLGAVVAMLMSTGIRDGRRAVIARTAAAAPFAAAGGASLGVLTAGHRLLGLGAFVLVSFAAVWVRRFGPRWFTLGFLFWQGFFFALFLHPPVGELPFLLVAIAASGLWVSFLLLTVLFDDPQARLLSIVVALRARARAGISAALAVLDRPGDVRAVRQLRANLIQLSEIALLLDGQLTDPRSLPEGVPPGRIRRWTVDFEIGMDEVAGAVIEISARLADVPEPLRVTVRQVLEALGWADQESAVQAARQIDSSDEGTVPAVRRLGSACLFLLDTVGRWDSGELRAPDRAVHVDPLDEEDGFEPVVALIGGNLPGSAVLAQQSIGRTDASRFSPSRMRLTTRQAVQAGVAAGLAIVAGEAISTQRFYWAVIAAFVAFAGTATSGETVRKGIGRIAGTLLGLFAAVGLADLTDGHRTVAVATILACILLAFFLQPVSYGLMVFFITIMLGQLYALLGTFSDSLLELRLAETAAGAAIGILVSLLVLPTHSRATLRVARKTFLLGLADLLDASAETLHGKDSGRNLLALTVALDAGGRQLVRTRRALTKGRLFGGDREGVRHRVSVLGAAGAGARTVAASVSPQRPNENMARGCELLAAKARQLAERPSLGRAVTTADGGTTVDEVRQLLAQVPADNRTALHALRRLNEALALLEPRPAVPPT